VPTVHSLRLTKCRESSYLTLCCTEPQKIGWLLILTEINQVALKCPGIKQTPISCPEEAVQILWKSYEEHNCDMWRQRCVFFFDLIAWHCSTILSVGSYFSDCTELNHVSAIPTTPTKTTFL